MLEVTLRTECALDAIRAMKEVPGAIVGAGTVTNEAELDAALDAGSEFIVSPGLTDTLGHAAIREGVPFLPGIANAGDIMRGLDLGLTHFKFFPAMAAGGLLALEGACCTLRPMPLLPDRRGEPCQCAGVARLRSGALRWRQLGCTQGKAGRGGSRAVGARGGGTAPLAEPV